MNLYEPNTQDNLHQMSIKFTEFQKSENSESHLCLQHKAETWVHGTITKYCAFFLFRPLGYYGVAFTPLRLSKNYDAL